MFTSQNILNQISAANAANPFFNETENNPVLKLMSLIMMSDSYKDSHQMSQTEGQFPPGMTHIESYGEHRVGSKYSTTTWGGLQYFLMEYLSKQITREHVEHAAQFNLLHGIPFNREGWMEIVEKHNGYLPIRIKSVAEGSVVPISNLLYKVEETDSRFAWLPQLIETCLVRATWYPSTVATKSWHMKKMILKHLLITSDDPFGEIDFKLHDFGARGVTCHEQAMIGGMAHLINFKGSDTKEGIWMANNYYSSQMAAFSIPAMEHATVTSWGRDREFAAYRNMVELCVRKGYKHFACVSDAYDFYRAVRYGWCGELHDLVKNSGATCVIRPDSGNPVEVNLKALQIIEEELGVVRNKKGFKVIPPYFRLIQGDGIKDEDSIDEIYSELAKPKYGYSATNLGFGSGGGLLQLVNRDTQKAAQKACLAVVDGKEIEVFKDPITDPGKLSKRGHLDLIQHSILDYETVNYDAGDSSCLLNVWDTGKLKVRYSLDFLRTRSMEALVASL